MGTVPNPQDMISEAVKALTFNGDVPVDEIPRDRAARLLLIWARRPKLTPAEVEAILAHFPETIPTIPADEMVLGEADYRRRLDAWGKVKPSELYYAPEGRS